MSGETKQATVRVRALVIVDPDGKWIIQGDGRTPSSK